MTDTKFTPGPWVLKIDEERFAWASVESSDGYVIAEFDLAEASRHGEQYWQEEKANAHLISAAADMYAALESLCAALIHPGNKDIEYWKNAVAALAKARSES